jgi:hypothetical protein
MAGIQNVYIWQRNTKKEKIDNEMVDFDSRELWGWEAE